MIIIHFNGCGYYYTTEAGKQLSKSYSSIARLRKYGKIFNY